MTHRKFKLSLVFIIFVIGIILRVSYLRHGLPDFEVDDEGKFANPAMTITFNLPNLLKTRNLELLNTDYFYPHPHGLTNTLVVVFSAVTGFYKLSGVGSRVLSHADFIFVARLFIAVVSGFIPLVIFWLLKKISGFKTAIIGLLISALGYYFIYYSHVVSPYPICALLVSLFLWRFYEFIVQPNRRNWIFTSIALGLVAGFNFGVIVFAIPIGLTLIYLCLNQALSLKKTIIYSLAMGLIVGLGFLIISPLSVVNFRITLAALSNVSNLQNIGAPSSGKLPTILEYFLGVNPEIISLQFLRPYSMVNAFGLPFAVLSLLSLVIALFSKNIFRIFLSLSFICALAFYSSHGSTNLRWLLPFLPIVVVLMTLSIADFSNLLRSQRVLIALVIVGVVLCTSLWQVAFFLRSHSLPDTRELALQSIRGEISKDAIILRPSFDSPPIWKYGYANNFVINHPTYGSSSQEQLPPVLSDVFCGFSTLNKERYLITVGSAANYVITSPSYSNEHPMTAGIWKKFYSNITTWPKVGLFSPTLASPMTGTEVGVYKVPKDFCGPETFLCTI
ncbi:MAG: glycosyltransferase family 39 protein [candidate division WWE3 bacterium]|nr:glycosyltransferase family 39 protein [candidate division WWE3 bacterium]